MNNLTISALTISDSMPICSTVDVPGPPDHPGSGDGVQPGGDPPGGGEVICQDVHPNIVVRPSVQTVRWKMHFFTLI